MNVIFPKEVQGVGTEYNFEGIKVKGPDMYDKYLNHFYGDYMTPPSENERNRHNVTVICCGGGQKSNIYIQTSILFAYFFRRGEVRINV